MDNEGLSPREKLRKQNRENYLKNRDERLARAKEYYAADRENLAAKTRARYAKNREKEILAARARRALRSAEIAKAKRDKYAANPEKYRAASARWAKAHPEATNAIARRQRARRIKAEGTHTPGDIAVIRKAQKDRCAMPDCKTRLRGKGHIDHIVALSKGGSDWPRNLQLLCASCNHSKHARDPIEFAQSRGLLL
jgi:5-methylcytosine-specific restriction endonuclease McrA